MAVPTWPATEIVEAIIDGDQPASLTASRLVKLYEPPIAWTAPLSILGFPLA